MEQVYLNDVDAQDHSIVVAFASRAMRARCPGRSVSVPYGSVTSVPSVPFVPFRPGGPDSAELTKPGVVMLLSSE